MMGGNVSFPLFFLPVAVAILGVRLLEIGMNNDRVATKLAPNRMDEIKPVRNLNGNLSFSITQEQVRLIEQWIENNPSRAREILLRNSRPPIER